MHDEHQGTRTPSALPSGLLNVDIKLLRVLEEMLRVRNGSAVARKLDMTPSAVSQGMNRLREVLGDALLVRNHDGYDMTPRARELQPLLQTLLKTWEGAIQLKSGFDPVTAQGHVTIACPGYMALDQIQALVSRMTAEMPGVRMEIDEVQTAASDFERVREGVWDILCTQLQPEETASDIYMSSLSPYRLTHLAMSLNNGMYGETMTLREYAAAQHVAMYRPAGDVSPQQNPVDLLLAGHRLPSRSVHYIRTWHVFASLIECSNAIALVGERQYQVLARHHQVRRVPIPVELQALPEIPVQLVWHQRTQGSPLHAYVRKRLREGLLPESVV